MSPGEVWRPESWKILGSLAYSVNAVVSSTWRDILVKQNTTKCVYCGIPEFTEDRQKSEAMLHGRNGSFFFPLVATGWQYKVGDRD